MLQYCLNSKNAAGSQPLSMRQKMIEMHRVREVMLYMPVCHPAFQPDSKLHSILLLSHNKLS